MHIGLFDRNSKTYFMIVKKNTIMKITKFDRFDLKKRFDFDRNFCFKLKKQVQSEIGP